jgi:hypothetical protein
VSTSTIGNPEDERSPRPSSLHAVRAALDRLESEQGVGPANGRSDRPACCLPCSAVVIARTASVTDERFAEIVREIDADR